MANDVCSHFVTTEEFLWTVYIVLAPNRLQKIPMYILRPSIANSQANVFKVYYDAFTTHTALGIIAVILLREVVK